MTDPTARKAEDLDETAAAAESQTQTAPADSAQKPPAGVSLTMRWPMVRTMRQPPKSVPAATAP